MKTVTEQIKREIQLMNLAKEIYKKDETNPIFLKEVLKIVEILMPSDIAKLWGLKASILNRLYKLGEVPGREVDEANNQFRVRYHTIYSFGTHLMSRIYLSDPKYAALNKDTYLTEENNYLTRSEALSAIERLKLEYPKTNEETDHDPQWFIDTKLLINLALGEKIDKSQIKMPNSIAKIPEIKEWLKK